MRPHLSFELPVGSLTLAPHPEGRPLRPSQSTRNFLSGNRPDPLCAGCGTSGKAMAAGMRAARPSVAGVSSAAQVCPAPSPIHHPQTRFVSAQVRISRAHAVERRAWGSSCPGERPVPSLRARAAPAAGEPITPSHPTALAPRKPPAPRLSRSAIYLCSPPRLCPIPSVAASGHLGAFLGIGATHGVNIGRDRHLDLILRPGPCGLCQFNLAERAATARRAILRALSGASATLWPARGGVCSVSLIPHRCSRYGSQLDRRALHHCGRPAAAERDADAVERVARRRVCVRARA